MNFGTDIAVLKYNEALKLPKFKASLARLMNREEFDYILVSHHLVAEALSEFIDKAISEGNAVLVEKENCGFCVTIWRD